MNKKYKKKIKNKRLKRKKIEKLFEKLLRKNFLKKKRIKPLNKMWLCFLKQYKEKYTLKKINKYLNEREIVYWDYLIKYLKQNRKKKNRLFACFKKIGSTKLYINFD